MTQLLTNVNQVLDILGVLQSHASDSRNPLDRVDELVTAVQANPNEVDWHEMFSQLGGRFIHMAFPWFSSNDHKAEFAEMLLRKHMMYGAEPLLAWKEIGIIIRIDSKFKRIKNLTAPMSEKHYESLKDNIVDCVGYCVLGYRMTSYLKGTQQ